MSSASLPTKRRQFIGQISSGIAGVGLAACGGSQAGGTGTNPTFVFVHGAWHGGWCWSKIVQSMGEMGYPAIAVDLPGHGVDARFPKSYLAAAQDPAALATEGSPLSPITLNDYRDHVINLIRGLMKDGSGPVILVGHSLGGATLSAVAQADPTLVRQLVYLTAFVPVKFPTVIQYIQDASFSASEVPALAAADPAKVGAFRINHNSADASYRAKNKSAFYGDVSDDVFAAYANLLTPDEPIQAFTTPVIPTAANWGGVKRTYIRCTLDRAIPISVQDKMIAEADALTPSNRFVQKTLDTSHSPFASAVPALTTTLLSIL